MQASLSKLNFLMTSYFTPPIKFLLFLFCIFFYSGVFAGANPTSIESALTECLETTWGLDKHTTAFVKNKFSPLLDNSKHHSVIQQFIDLSKKQNIHFPVDKQLKHLPPQDGILKAPKEHKIVFENPYIRVLWGSTEPGAREEFHEHAWKSVMVIIIPTTYEIEYSDSKKEIIDYPISAIELPGGERYACTNLGKKADASLRFEIKD